jgi:hypothetical protein
MMNQPQAYTVKAEVLQGVVDYLGTRPLKEVLALFTALQQSVPVFESEPVVKPADPSPGP